MPTVTTTTESPSVANDALSSRPRNPFVGLRPFNTDESILFFGRRQQTVELMEKLHRTHFIGVVGSSGCGKSSLIRAGLIPNLKAGFLVEDRDRWLVAMMKPGDAPLHSLATTLIETQSAVRNSQSAIEMADVIRAGGAQAVVESLMPQLADTNLLLLVDQFEEIFRFGVESGEAEKRGEAADFVSIMLELGRQRRLPIYVVMTMRSDFLGDCDNFYGLPEAMNRSQYLVPRLTRQQRQQAIEGPIRLSGASISSRLLDRVLNDVSEQSDQLPVMQHAIMRTWERWRQSGDAEAIDLQYYEAVGTIKDALSRDADAALEGMSEEELKIAERMFQALTDTDARNRRIRRPVHLSEIAAITGASSEKIQEIIEKFKGENRSFLTTTNDGDPLIDISHESLIRQWETMSEWVKAEAESREMYRRVADASGTYNKYGKKRDLLWSGTQLQLALNWKKEREPNRQWARRYGSDFDPAMNFLSKSRADESRRKRLLWSVIATAFVVLLGLTLFAWWQQRKAKRQEQTANQLYYAANMNLAQVAFENNRLGQLYNLLNTFLPARENQHLASAREFYWYHLWHESHYETETLKGHEASVLSVAFAPDGKTLASASSDRTVKLWDRATGTNLATLKGHEDRVLSVAFAPDGETLASASDDRTVKLWDRATGANLATLKGHEASVSSVAFAPDGKTLASASWDKTVKLWDRATGANLATLKGHEAYVSSVAFAPDGKTLASASWNQTVKLWDRATGANLTTLKGHDASVSSVAFAPDSKTLASAGGGDEKKKEFPIRLWFAATDEAVARQRNR